MQTCSCASQSPSRLAKLYAKRGEADRCLQRLKVAEEEATRGGTATSTTGSGFGGSIFFDAAVVGVGADADTRESVAASGCDIVLRVFDELQRRGIHTVAQMGRLGAVVKNMT